MNGLGFKWVPKLGFHAIKVSVQEALTAELKARATSLGYVRVGVAEAAPLGVEADRLRAWLAAGRHGSMDWMHKTAEVRADPTDGRMVDGARSVVVLVAPYARKEEWVGAPPGKVARYARGRDYHNVLGKRGRKLGKWLRAKGFEARVSVDSMPVFERAWAQRAGVGFIGKNACLIVPGVGSHAFLSCLVTTARLTPDEPIKERCGDCRACLDACPTQALVGPRELDARRCISYLTIENRGAIPEEHREAVGEWLFGCDVCQDVCPYNHGTPPPLSTTSEFAPGERWGGVSAADVLSMREDDFQSWARGSPLKRAGLDGLARNAAIVLGNHRDKHHLPVLSRAASHHGSPHVREAATWAIGQLSGREGDG